MTVTEEQWAAAAADQGMTVEEMRAKIAEINERDEISLRDMVRPYFKLPPPAFDRDGDPLTLGEWSILHGSWTYKCLAETHLPNGYWVATIWNGINEDGDDPPVVLQTGVFSRPPNADRRLPNPSFEVRHRSVTGALKGHEALVEEYRKIRART